MEKKIKDIFKNSEIELPTGLRQVVFERIEREKMNGLARKRLFMRIGFVVSGISSVVAVAIFGRELLLSEFWSIASLGITDMQIILAHWQSFGLSLLETFPTVAVASMLTPVLLTLILMKKYSEQEHMQTFNNQKMSFRAKLI